MDLRIEITGIEERLQMRQSIDFSWGIMKVGIQSPSLWGELLETFK